MTDRPADLGQEPGNTQTPVIISFEQLFTIRMALVKIEEDTKDIKRQLKDLRAEKEDHETRLQALEDTQLARDARVGLGLTAWRLVEALALAIIASGVFWPQLVGIVSR